MKMFVMHDYILETIYNTSMMTEGRSYCWRDNEKNVDDKKEFGGEFDGPEPRTGGPIKWLGIYAIRWIFWLVFGDLINQVRTIL